jgi:hypothetical protein
VRDYEIVISYFNFYKISKSDTGFPVKSFIKNRGRDTHRVSGEMGERGGGGAVETGVEGWKEEMPRGVIEDTPKIGGSGENRRLATSALPKELST